MEGGHMMSGMCFCGEGVEEASVDSDWSTMLAYLPTDWEEMARKLGAFTRARGFSSPESLLRTLFIHLAEGCSLRETSVRAMESCKYVVLFTTLSEDELSLEEVFSVYRLRWQIELAFKRLKSLTGFGHLPKHDPASCRAWLYGKLLVGLLVESMVRIPFPP